LFWKKYGTRWDAQVVRDRKKIGNPCSTAIGSGVMTIGVREGILLGGGGRKKIALKVTF